MGNVQTHEPQRACLTPKVLCGQWFLRHDAHPAGVWVFVISPLLHLAQQILKKKKKMKILGLKLKTR